MISEKCPKRAAKCLASREAQPLYFPYPNLGMNLKCFTSAGMSFRYTLSSVCDKRISSLCIHAIAHLRMRQNLFMEDGAGLRLQIQNQKLDLWIVHVHEGKF